MALGTRSLFSDSALGSMGEIGFIIRGEGIGGFGHYVVTSVDCGFGDFGSGCGKDNSTRSRVGHF